MPADALPQPAARPHAGSVLLRRVYRDALGRPLTGKVRLTGNDRAQDGHHVTVQAPVHAEVVAGVLELWLPVGTYALSATLTTADGIRTDDTETVELA